MGKKIMVCPHTKQRIQLLKTQFSKKNSSIRKCFYNNAHDNISSIILILEGKDTQVNSATLTF